MLLNDLLKLSGKELFSARIKFNQTNDEGRDPYKIYKINPEEVNTGWFLWHNERHYFNQGQIAICLVKMPNGNWLLTTVKRIIEVKKDIHGNVGYEAEELEQYRHLFGNVVIKYKKSRQQGYIFNNIKDGLEIVRANYHRRTLIAHVAWMDRYDGIDGDKPYRGGAFGDRGIDDEIKGEIYNFRRHVDGKAYGFVEPHANNRAITLSRIEPLLDESENSVDCVTVIFVAPKKGESGKKIVGFYENATVYKYEKNDVTDRLNINTKKDFAYNICCDYNDAYLIEPEKRKTFEAFKNIMRATVVYGDNEMQNVLQQYVFPYLLKIIADKCFDDKSEEVDDVEVVENWSLGENRALEHDNSYGRKTDWVKKTRQNCALGKIGEEVVLRYERKKLNKVGRSDLVDGIVHISEEIGDGLGYDIKSFDENGKELHIEVKTSTNSNELSFYMSENEKITLESDKSYVIYYVVGARSKKPKIYIISRDDLINKRILLNPEQYRVLTGIVKN